jgi:glycerol kinase
LEEVVHDWFMAEFIMAIDQGTTGTTVIIVDQGGGLVAQATTEFRQHFPKPGWVEHDPEEIWASVRKSIALALKKSSLKAEQMAGIGITNQRETVLVWDRVTGKPIYNAIVWQCRRTTDFCEQLKKTKSGLISRKTGLVVDPYFSASKVRWILQNVPGAAKKAKAGDLVMGTMDTFLLWRLTGGAAHKTDVSNASRTMLMNIHTGRWDNELLKIFGIPESMLPDIDFSSGVFAKTEDIGILPDGIPISGMAGDQQAALFGQTCFQAGEAKCTFGTGSFMLMNTGFKPMSSKFKLLTTVAWRLPGQPMTYAIEGGAFICGAAVQWLRDGLGIINSSSEVENLALQCDSTDGVQFVPALTGLGAPYWDPTARGVLVGLTRGTGAAQIARATLEAMALQNCEILKVMEKDSGKKLKTLKVDGGAVSNNLLMQIQADYLGSAVQRPTRIETTALGAAYLAGLGIGYWPSLKALSKIAKVDKVFKPKISKSQRTERLKSWQRAVAKTAP